MENILTYENLIENIETIDSQQEQIIAFICAPYYDERIQKVVNQFYDAWNIRFEESLLHLYWIGYIHSYNQKPERGRIFIDDSLCFDTKIFHTLINELDKKWGFHYADHFEINLFQCLNHKINFKDHIRIELEDKLNTPTELKDTIHIIDSVLRKYQTFYVSKKEIKRIMHVKRLRKVDLDTLLKLLNIRDKVFR